MKLKVNETVLIEKSVSYPPHFRPKARSADFRPVFRMKCVSAAGGYDIEVDASSGSVLTFHQTY